MTNISENVYIIFFAMCNLILEEGLCRRKAWQEQQNDLQGKIFWSFQRALNDQGSGVRGTSLERTMQSIVPRKAMQATVHLSGQRHCEPVWTIIQHAAARHAEYAAISLILKIMQHASQSIGIILVQERVFHLSACPFLEIPPLCTPNPLSL